MTDVERESRAWREAAGRMDRDRQRLRHGIHWVRVRERTLAVILGIFVAGLYWTDPALAWLLSVAALAIVLVAICQGAWRSPERFAR